MCDVSEALLRAVFVCLQKTARNSVPYGEVGRDIETHQHGRDAHATVANHTGCKWRVTLCRIGAALGDTHGL